MGEAKGCDPSNEAETDDGTRNEVSHNGLGSETGVNYRTTKQSVDKSRG